MGRLLLRLVEKWDHPCLLCEAHAVTVGPSRLPGKSVIGPWQEGELGVGKVGVGTWAFWVPRRAAGCPTSCGC